MVKWQHFLVVVVLRSPIHANEPSEYNGMLYRSSNRVLNNGIKVIILICMDGTSQYHHYPLFEIPWLNCQGNQLNQYIDKDQIYVVHYNLVSNIRANKFNPQTNRHINTPHHGNCYLGNTSCNKYNVHYLLD